MMTPESLLIPRILVYNMDKTVKENGKIDF